MHRLYKLLTRSPVQAYDKANQPAWFFLPVWTLEELIAAAKEEPDLVSDATVEQLFAVWGGKAR